MKQLKKLLAVMLMLCMVFTLCACNGDSGNGEETKQETKAESQTEKETEAETEKSAAFTLKVVDNEGNAVPDVVVQVCKDTCVPGRTDANGEATFNVEITDGYKVSVLSCPEGYEYTGDAEVYLESGITEFTVEINKVN